MYMKWKGMALHFERFLFPMVDIILFPGCLFDIFVFQHYALPEFVTYQMWPI